MNAEPVRVSWQRTPDGTPLGKAHSIDAAGQLHSAMTTRWVKGCIAVETEVRTLHELLDQAVDLGGCAHRFSGTFDPGAKVNGKVLRSGGEAPGATADFLDHREGPGVLCIDIDKKYQRDPWLTHEQVRAGLVAVAPWLEGVGLLVMDSSGSCIALDGQEVRGPGGVHAYALVDSAPMIKALLEDGHRRSYLAGLGKVIVSAGAGFLERSTFDLALRPPTQPDFVVPHLGSPRLSRSRAPSIFPGGRIPATVELLSSAEVARYKRMAEAEKLRLDPERKAKVEECALARGMVAHEQLGGHLADHVAAARQAFGTQTLPLDFAIPLGNGKHLTVAEMLADPARVPKGWSLPDPLDPAYGPHRAKFDADAGVIISLAHGARRTYQLGARPGPTPDGSEPETDVGEAPVIDLSGADGEKTRATPKPGAAEIVLSVSEIFAPLPPVSWVCQALDMAPGAPVLVAGYGYSGKTVTVQDFALATASGSLAWGRFPVREGRVLHLDYEQGSYLTRLRYQRLADARGLDPRSIEGRLVVRPFPPWYLDAETDDFLAGLVDGFDLVIVDSFRAACPGTEENSSDARVPLDRLTRLSERTGALSIVLHHARKPSQDPRKQGGGLGWRSGAPAPSTTPAAPSSCSLPRRASPSPSSMRRPGSPGRRTTRSSSGSRTSRPTPAPRPGSGCPSSTPARPPPWRGRPTGSRTRRPGSSISCAPRAAPPAGST